MAGNRKTGNKYPQRSCFHTAPLFFFWGVWMKKYKKKEAIQIVTQAAKDYRQRYEQHRFLIVYRGNDGALEMEEASFTAQNYLHLTGLVTKLPPATFYDACLNGQLAEDDFRFDDYGNAHRKLAVLPYLKELLYGSSLIGEYTPSGIRLYADYFVGDSRGSMSLGFKRVKRTSFPSTLYQGSAREVTIKAFKVLAVFTKHYKDGEYADCIYIARDEDEDAIRAALGV